MHQHAGTDSAMSMEPFTTVGFQKGCVFLNKFLLLLSLLFLTARAGQPTLPCFLLPI